MIYYDDEGKRTAEKMEDMPTDFIPCEAEGCNTWFSGKNVTNKGYCHDHKRLIKERS
jgi:hypothetical protein